MSLSDSDDDLIPPSKQQMANRAAAKAAALSDSDDDAFADVFRPKPKAQQRQQQEEDGYTPPARSHICDECEGSFREAVFCGECSMTYCLACDQRYHSGSEDVRVHYRSALHGSVPQAIARQVAAEQAEEEREAARQRQRDEESLQRQADERAARRRLHDPMGAAAGFSDDDEEDRAAAAARDARPKDQWQQVGSAAANEARRMFYPSQAHSAPRGSMPPPAGPLSPSASASAAWRPQSPLARSAASMAAAAYPVPPPPAHAAAAASRNATGVSFALDPFGSTGPPLQGRPRPGSAAASASRASRPASAGPRPMVVLQSTRPASASRGRVVSNPTRVGVQSSDPSLSGKSRFNRNMTIRSTGGAAAAIHQRLAPRDGGFAATKARTGQGAHANPAVHTWAAESADPSTVALHSAMLGLKAEVSALERQKQLYKTAVLKRQKALKEIGRIAANLARQPNAEPMGREDRSASGGGFGSSTAPVSTAGGGELGDKVASLRTSVEILRLEVEDLTAKLVATRSQGDARSAQAREQAALERERGELARAVSIAAASRELDAFKRVQLLADLRFALAEMTAALDSKKQETTRAKMQAMQIENQNESMQRDYARIQNELDQWAAKQVS